MVLKKWGRLRSGDVSKELVYFRVPGLQDYKSD